MLKNGNGWKKASFIVTIAAALTTLVWQATVQFITHSVQAEASELENRLRGQVREAIQKHEKPGSEICWHNCLDKTIGAQSADIEQIQADVHENQKTLNALYNSLGRVSGKIDVILRQLEVE